MAVGRPATVGVELEQTQEMKDLLDHAHYSRSDASFLHSQYYALCSVDLFVPEVDAALEDLDPATDHSHVANENGETR